MQGNWLRIGEFYINADRIIAINTNAKWLVVTEESRNEYGEVLPKATEERSGIGIVMDVDPKTIDARDLGTGYEPIGHRENCVMLRYVRGSQEAEQILEQCSD